MSNQIIVKYKKKKRILEIMCDKRYIKDFKSLNSLSEKKAYLPKLLIVDTIFSDYKKGNVAKTSDVNSICKSTNNTDAILFILEFGDIPLSSSERRQLVDQKRAGIINYFVTNFLDPTGKKPHPATRIDSALKSIKGLVIDPHKPVEIQAIEILKRLKNILILVKNSITTTVNLSHSQLGTGLNILHKYSTILNEDYNEEGATFEIETTKTGYEHIINFLSFNNESSNDTNEISYPNNKSYPNKKSHPNKNKGKNNKKNKSRNKFRK